MKHLKIVSNTLIALLTFTACSSSKSNIAPSNNSALNSISKSSITKKKQDGAMQKSLEEWFQKDWEPTISKDKDIQKKYMKKTKTSHKKIDGEKEEYIEKKNKSFTLQEYVDKAAAYNKAHPGDYNYSYTKKVESLPVIGK